MVDSNRDLFLWLLYDYFVDLKTYSRGKADKSEKRRKPKSFNLTKPLILLIEMHVQKGF